MKRLHRGDARGVGSLLLSRRFDFAAWGEELIEGRMGVFVYARMQEHNLLALLPRQLASRLRDQHQQQQSRNQALLMLLAEADRRLRGAGLGFVLLKGFPVAERFWGGIDRRFSMDLDLLVQRDQLPAAVTALAGMGCATPSLTPAARTLALRLSHALELTCGDLSLDLHWTLRNRPGIDFDLDRIWSGIKQERIGGVDCAVLSDRHQLLILLVGLANDLERGHHRLCSYWDIYLILNRLPQFDWRAFLANHDATGVTALLVNVLALVLYRLDCRDEFRNLVSALDAHGDLLSIQDADTARIALSRPPQSLAARQWFARLLPQPVWRYWFWWVTTLPLRFLLGRHI